MPKDKYEAAKEMFKAKKVDTLAQLLALVKKTSFARAAKTTPERFDKMIEDAGLCRLSDFYHMAQVLDLDDDRIILDLFYKEFVKQRKKRKA